MELAMGAIGSVLPRLAELLKEEYKLQKGVKNDVESLSRELAAMHIALERVAKVPREMVELDVKLWASNVRELSYAIEDAIDAFVVRVAEGSNLVDPINQGFFKRILRKTSDLIKTGKARREIADGICDIKELADEVAKLRARYKFDAAAAAATTPATATVDPRILALYKDITELVGIEEARDELIGMLSRPADDDQLNIVSVVGFGGLGKTTLAKLVYDKLKGQFDCAAFVSVGQNPDLKKVLTDMIYDLDRQRYISIHNSKMDERLLINELRDFLHNKRYIIIIDDIWDEKLWEYIKCAFYRNKLCSRIITTTRKVTVSKACCSHDDAIYRMKPLSDDASKRLFYKRIFKHDNGCPPELEQVSIGILKKCAGMPLAIITIASLLANKQVQTRDQWHDVFNSIGRGLTEEPKVEDMTKILSFSYYDLPCHLKTCLLYLSIFPEDFIISRDHLVRMWIAEGVVQKTTNQKDDVLVELGENYFYELINRSMIQPWDENDFMYYKDGYDNAIISCRVHDMVLDLILSLSKEENFVTILDQERGASSLSKAHRISLRDCNVVHTIPEATVPKVRFLSLLRADVHMTPAITSFPILRVLDLYNCHFEESYHLKHLGNLFHLRYLRLHCGCITKLPNEIGNLQFLQTLDVHGSRSIKELPPAIYQLRRLMFLYFPENISLSDRIGELTSLLELSPVDVFRRTSSIDVNGDSFSLLKALGNLTELRDLTIEVWSSEVSSIGRILGEVLCNLHKLRRLILRGVHGIVHLDSLPEFLDLPQHIHVLGIKPMYFFTVLPVWFNSPIDLPYLSFLDLSICDMRQEHVEKLGRLPALQVLWIQINRESEWLVIGAGAFPSLTDCTFIQYCGLVFQPGAMPKVRKLEFNINVVDSEDINFDVGLGNLASIEEVTIDLLCEDAVEWEVEEVENVLRHVADIHPKHPTLEMRRSDEDKMVLDDEEEQQSEDPMEDSDMEENRAPDSMASESS
uniref:NBS-LRR-like resistance protein n=1 Tax=Oryza glaberrima TaxID=4538 RepID=A0A6M3VY82_ORYGL|nr:NBS-LRR-like resistance protein [Oryza glaberrima]QJF45580.1 NBS-LRR-like resistance protein [Oryza glaberrima]